MTEKEDVADIMLSQKIFKHLRGHEMILAYIEVGTVVLEENYRYFDVSRENMSNN